MMNVISRILSVLFFVVFLFFFLLGFRSCETLPRERFARRNESDVLTLVGTTL